MEDESRMVEEAFAANLKLAREQRNLSQEQVAERMAQAGYKWHQATVYKVETGAREVKIGEAHALAEILGVSVSVLLAPGSDAAETAKIAAAYGATREKRDELLDAISRWEVAQSGLRSLMTNPWTRDPNDLPAQHLPRKTADEIQKAVTETLQDVVDEYQVPF